MNSILENDIAEITANSKYFEAFKGNSVLITGATGLIGSILTKSLLKSGNIKVFACCRNKEKFQKVFENYICENLVPVYSDILTLDISNFSIDYIIHGASITDSKTFIEKPVETITTAIDGTRNLLQQCVSKNIKGFVYLSSLEVYGTFPEFAGIKNVTENDSGYIDAMSVRSSYSESKRLVETLCKSYQSEYNVPVKIARLCQTFGAGVEYSDNRVFAQFARAVIEDKDIILKTKGETVRNYCYTTDAVTGILTVLAKGQSGCAYNIANPQTTISIAQMAQLACNLNTNHKSKVVFDIAEDASKLGYNPVVKIQLDSKRLIDLGWTPVVNLNEMYVRLINSLKD